MPVPRIDLVVGARPNFVKAAPVLAALRARCPAWDIRLIHTGQHYDERLSDLLFRQLRMPTPDVNLGVGSGTHTTQTARVMLALEEYFSAGRPDLLLVFGDINSTVAAALVASKLGLPLAHVEAGLRSFDRTMPEEINRLVTDALADLLFITEPEAERNLLREGCAPQKIHFTGNTMIDSLVAHRSAALALDMPARLGVAPGRYLLVTLHRPSNVDTRAGLVPIMTVLSSLAREAPVIFPVHPRTAHHLREWGLWEVSAQAGVRLLEPLGYLEFLGLMASAGCVLTDSGGVQEETTSLKVPCVTLRRNTERPITVSGGTNLLVGDDPQRAAVAVRRALAGDWPTPPPAPQGWDGRAAERVAAICEEWVAARVRV
jgi:UDP-N-acetylglucosamine 2-epimerase (non-hydrolysing)